MSYINDFKSMGALGEFMGTLILILIGDGVVAGVLLGRSRGHGASWIVITAGWSFAVMCGIFTSKSLGGTGDINPVGPICAMATGDLETKKGLMLIAAEFLGAFAGAVLVFLH